MRQLLAFPALLSATLLCAQFSAQRMIDHTAVDRPHDVDLGDVDGDGDVDVVVVTSGYDAGPVWFPNRGDGTFLPRRVVGYGGSFVVTELVDLDQDGDLDVVGISAFPGEVYWFANDGVGNFGPIQMISTLADEGKDVHVADVDGDGDLDVLSASYGNNSVAWYANDGNQVFGAQQLIAVVAGAYAVRTADLDDDGDLDVAAGGQGVASQAWYRNNGSGTFTAVPVADPGFGQWGVVLVVDVNGDTYPDVVGQSTGAGWTRWYANDGTGQFAAGITMMTGSQLVCMAMADLDGDTDPDLMTADRWWVNDGAGSFTLGALLVDPGFDPWGVEAADLNGDAIPDVVGAYFDDSHVTVSMGLGAGAFEPYRIIAAYQDDIRSVVAADLDGDGYNDVIEAVYSEDKLSWYHNEGDNTFSLERVVSTLADATTCVRAADLDGDGDLDLLSQNSGADNMAWCANDGAGNFGALQVISATGNGTVVEVADMDGDDDLDILGTNASSAFSVFTNDGSGTFDAGTVIGAGTPLAIAVGDLDGDGDLDLLSGDFNVNAYLNQGGGVYTNSHTLSIAPNTVRSMAAVDVDADGDLDLSYYDQGPYIKWLRNDGSGSFDPQENAVWMNFDTDHYLATDADGDGLTDILYAAEGSLFLTRNLGAELFDTQAVITAVAGAGTRLCMGDLDADGDGDLITGSNVEGKLAWYENYFLSAQRFEGIVFNDVDGDGTRDPDEIGMENLPVQVSPSIPALFSLAGGRYAAHVEAGSYALTTNIDTSLWSITTPDPRTVDITADTPVLTGIDVGVIADVDTTILIPSLTLAPAVCGANTTLWLSVANAGTRIEECEFVVVLDPLFTFVSSTPPPTTIAGNTYVWAVQPLPWSSTITIPLVVTMPPGTELGSPYLLDLTVINHDPEGAPLDEFPSKILDTLQCSYDPNDKLVDPRGYGIYGAVEVSSDTLDYTIRFQNTGNAPAETVMLRDQLDAILDPERVQLLGHSHPITLMRVEADGELVVRFDDIQLPGAETDPTGSQGFVRFRIKPDVGVVQHLSTAHNTAGIFFDLNEPVITNTTLTTWVDCALWQPTLTLFGVDSLVAEAGDAYQWYRDGELLPDITSRIFRVGSSGTYTAAVTSAYGCIAQTEPITVVATGIPSLPTSTVVVRPNPFTTGTQLVFTEALTSQDRIALYDAQGRLLRWWNGAGSNQIWLPRGDLKSGVYALHVLRAGERAAVVRVVVE